MGTQETTVLQCTDLDELKDIPVGITIIVNSPITRRTARIEYGTDLYRFTRTYLHVNSDDCEYAQSELHEQLLYKIRRSKVLDEELFTLGMYYLVSHSAVCRFLNSVPSEPIGFLINLSPFEVRSRTVLCLDYETWESFRDESEYPFLYQY